jgi:hypothetical protein
MSTTISTPKVKKVSKKRAAAGSPSSPVLAALDSILRAVQSMESHSLLEGRLQGLKLELDKLTSTTSATSDGGASSISAAVPKKKRAPSEFNNFVRDAMKLGEVSALPSKERMKVISAIWQLFKSPDFQSIDVEQRLAAAATKWKETAPPAATTEVVE